MKSKKIRDSVPYIFAAILFPLSSFANPDVTDVVAKQRYPWNGLVDITCTVSGMNGGIGDFAVSAKDPDSGKVTVASHVQVVRDGLASNALEVQGDGNYRLLWDAYADLGEIVRSNMVLSVNVHGKVQLWEGGPYWATENIGAEKTEDYGLYFWWGDTIGYRNEGNTWVASDGTSSNFSIFLEEDTPTWWKTAAILQSEGWITADGVLALEHDAAHVHWGGSWRMPTVDEISALQNNCDKIWTTLNGVNGCVFRGRGAYASASIFLPSAGLGYVTETGLHYAGSQGFYWSMSPSFDDSYNGYTYLGWCLHFDSGSHYTDTDSSRRNYGFSVRPVQGFAQ